MSFARRHIAGLRSQRGGTLLILVVILVLGGMWALVSALNVARNDTAAKQTSNAAVLQQAKSALLGYLAIKAGSSDNPGILPCPEDPNPTPTPATEGKAAGYCTLPAIGRLPWSTLGMDKLTDSAGEPLWYVLSPGFNSASPAAALNLKINSNTAAQLTLDGTAAAAVALIIAPGSAINAQATVTPSATMTCVARNQVHGQTYPFDYRDYLECDNSTSPADSSFVSTGPRLTASNEPIPGAFNDQVLAVTHQDIFSIVEPVVATRIEHDIKPGLVTYFSQWANAFPYPARFANPAPDPWPGPGTSATRTQSQYIGDATVANEGGGNGRGLLPVTSTATYSLQVGSSSVTLTGGTADSISGTSCSTNAAPISGFSCTFNIVARHAVSVCGNSTPYCMVDPSFTVRGDIANVALSFANMADADVTVTSSGGTSRAMSSTILTRNLSSAGVATVTFQGTHTYSRYRTSTFTRLMKVTFPVIPSAITSPDDPFAGWYIRNEWYRVTYYVVSPLYLPGAYLPILAPCDPPPAPVGKLPCLQVNNMSSYYASPNTNKRALLILAGRSLNGSTRPSSIVSDYLEGENASPGDYTFEHGRGKVSSTGVAINDSVVVIAP